MSRQKKKHTRQPKSSKGKPVVSSAQLTAREQLEADLEEIKSMGLVDRAIQEFKARVPNAQIEDLQIGYFGDTTVVWCDLTYRCQNSDSSETKGFGFNKLSGSEWKLEWPEKRLSPLTPLPPFRPLGRFRLTSPTVVVTDPGYDEETARIETLGCFVEPCAVGMWRAAIAKDSTLARAWKMPRALLLVHERFKQLPPTSDQWQRLGKPVGGDGGVLVACDFAHFHDAGLVPGDQKWILQDKPADPQHLWSCFVCEILKRKIAAVIPHGAVVHWDGGMHVDVFRAKDQVVAIRLSISGWPNDI